MSITDVNVLIADDHKMIRDGLRLMLSLQNRAYNFFITEANDGGEAVALCLKKNFDIILMDYQMPVFNGDDAARRILMYKPSAKIIILSSYEDTGFVQSSIRSGARGYILKNIETSELVEAITTVLDGGTYFSSAVKEKTEYREEEYTEADVKATCKQFGISDREAQILRYVASEYTNDEIAKVLKISKRTVDTHRHNLMFKLKAKNTAGLVKFAYANKLLR